MMNERSFSLHQVSGEGQFEIRSVSGRWMTRAMGNMFQISILIKNNEGGWKEVEHENLGLSEDRRALRFRFGYWPAFRVTVMWKGEHVVGSPCSPGSENKKKLYSDMKKEILSLYSAHNGLHPDADRKLSVVSTVETTREISTISLSDSEPSKTGKELKLDLSTRISWNKEMSIRSVGEGGILDGPQGFCILKSGNIVVADKIDQVVMFNSKGIKIKMIEAEAGQGFSRPGDMVTLHNGDFAVKDRSGIQVFNASGTFVYRAWTNRGPWKCFGLAEDGERRLWFIDCSREDTHIKCIDKLGKTKYDSKCRFLTFAGGFLYVTDLGLDRVYIVSPDNQKPVKQFGGTGKRGGEFSDPAGLEVDQVGNILVADSRNHRLCVFDKNGNWIKKLEVDVTRPSAIRMDREQRKLYVLNMNGKEALVKFRAG